MKEREELIAAYVPVLHQGYIDLFDRHPDATVGIYDHDILDLFSYLKKDIRALRPDVAVEAIEGLGRNARFLGQTAMHTILLESDTAVVMPDDDVSRGMMDLFDIPESRVSIEPVFLRWDRQNTKVNIEVEPTAKFSVHELDPAIIALLNTEQLKSNNSWRRVGAVSAYGNTILSSSHNHSLPTEYSSQIDADARNTARRGESIETSTDIHAESGLIASMAKEGISLNHTDMYVTTFPCPNCAKLIAMSGIKRCFYAEGYAMLDGQSVLESAGVEIIKIDGFEPSVPELSTKPYPPAN